MLSMQPMLLCQVILCTCQGMRPRQMESESHDLQVTANSNCGDMDSP